MGTRDGVRVMELPADELAGGLVLDREDGLVEDCEGVGTGVAEPPAAV